MIDDFSFFIFVFFSNGVLFLDLRSSADIPSPASDACIEFKVFRVILFCRENLPNALLDPLPILPARTTSQPRTVTRQRWH